MKRFQQQSREDLASLVSRLGAVAEESLTNTEQVARTTAIEGALDELKRRTEHASAVPSQRSTPPPWRTPLVRQVMDLFIDMTTDERRQFFVWYARGMKD